MFSTHRLLQRVLVICLSISLTSLETPSVALATDQVTAPPVRERPNMELSISIPANISKPIQTIKALESLDLQSPQSQTNSATSMRNPEEWQSWPVIPILSEKMLATYQRGLTMGNDPHAFSKIGDGEISAAWFLTDFDLGSDYYNLGTNTGLQTTIAYYSGSFGRKGEAARRGFNAQHVLDPALADPQVCITEETPLDCEIRLHHSSFVLISMGTNQVWQPEAFEKGLREIIETSLNRGVVPILSTKADNLEGDHRINLIIARLAVEYDLPVWNFWSAVQSLPDHGLQEDREHLTYYPNNFSVPEARQFAWPVRNLSALQVLESLMNTTRKP